MAGEGGGFAAVTDWVRSLEDGVRDVGASCLWGKECFFMICPGCGKEMEAGWLYAGRTLFWSATPDKVFLRPDRKSVSLRVCADAPAAHICRDCQKIVLDYK